MSAAPRPVRVVVECPGTRFYEYLRRELSAAAFQVIEMDAGFDSDRAWEEAAPDVAVLGGLCERPASVARRVRQLRRSNRGISIVAVDTGPLSPESFGAADEADELIDGWRLTRPVGPELLRAVAAASSTSRPPRERAPAPEHAGPRVASAT